MLYYNELLWQLFVSGDDCFFPVYETCNSTSPTGTPEPEPEATGTLEPEPEDQTSAKGEGTKTQMPSCNGCIEYFSVTLILSLFY